MEILLIVLYLIVNFLSLKYNIHIFQLNYYTPSTQLKWTMKNWKKFLGLIILNVIGIVTIILNNKIGIIVSLGTLLINAYIVLEKNVKKKIVFTKRVIRLFITNYIILIALGFILKNNIDIFNITLLLINAVIPIYMILLNYINKPINNAINQHYVNDAKKILKSMPNLKIITITGSYGKTSTKNYLAKILSEKYNVLYTPGNFNTLLGITRTIRTQLKPTHEIFVCEVGIDRVGEMEKINKLVQSNFCMITAIGPQHLETFKTQENIIKSKLKIMDGLKDGGVAFLNLDNEYLRNSKIERKYIGYGIENNDNNKMKITNVSYGAKGLEFSVNDGKDEYKFNSKLLGDHNLVNLFGAITVAEYLGVPMKEIANAVKHIESVEHRLKLIPGNEYNLIDDSYNSNPIGATNALKVLGKMQGIRILITPGMVELGDKQYEYNYNFGEVAAKNADYIFLVNKQQTLPIYNALMDKKYPSGKVEVVDDFNTAMKKARKVENDGKAKYILIENGLPDNY